MIRISKKLKFIKKDDLSIFLACMAIATLFWLLNALGREYISKINYPIKILYKLSAKKRKRVTKIPSKVSLEVSGKGWDLLKFKFKKTEPIKLVVNRYIRRNYISNLELRKAFKKKNIDNFTINKVITKKIKVYER